MTPRAAYAHDVIYPRPFPCSPPYIEAPWHFLNFFPEPHGHGSLRPTVDQSTGPLGCVSPNVLGRPAPTIGGSFLADTGVCWLAGAAAGVSAGPTSTTPRASPEPFDFAG